MTGLNLEQVRTEMNRLRLNIGPRLVLCFALILLSTLAGDVIVLWQFHTVPRPGEVGYDTWPKDFWQRNGGVSASFNLRSRIPPFAPRSTISAVISWPRKK